MAIRVVVICEMWLYSYMRNGCVYMRIHSMRDVAVDLYARWCVYIYIHSMRDVAVDLYARWCVYIHTCMRDPTFYNIDSFALFELPLHGGCYAAAHRLGDRGRPSIPTGTFSSSPLSHDGGLSSDPCAKSL